MALFSRLSERIAREVIRLAAGVPAYLPSEQSVVASHPSAVRVMTYNAHGCVGTDHQLSVERIASVLARYRVDVAALQEIDVRQARSGYVDQAESLARLTGMNATFCAAIRKGDERYGNAILSRFPLRVEGQMTLPRRTPGAESRSALWVTIAHPDGDLHVVTTHLSVDRDERVLQTRALLEDWVSDVSTGALVLCGDFNARPGSPVHALLSSALRDARQQRAPAARRATWPAPMPVFRLDHVFIGQRIHLDGVEVPFNRLTRTASDHLPVIATVRMF